MLQNFDTIEYAVLDTETSGVSRQDVVIQCAIAFYDSSGTEISHYNEYWKLPPNIEINPRAQEVHNITTDMLAEKGLDPEKEIAVISNLLTTLHNHKICIVAHNASFDARLLSQTAVACGVRWNFDSCNLFCTMKAARSHIGLLNASGRPKMPSNSECYQFLFECEPNTVGDLHDALTYARPRPRARC